MLKHLFTFGWLFITLLGFSQQYPITKKVPKTITKHGIAYQDEYSWLENMKENEVVNWKNAQNEVINLHKAEIEKKYDIASKIKDYDTYSSNGLPIKKGAFFYGVYRMQKNKPGVLCFKETLNEQAVELVDPFKIFKDENATIFSFYPSVNSLKLAYEINRDGSDRKEIRFVTIDPNKNLEDVLTDVKFSNVAWHNDSGVFYKRNTNNNNFAQDSTHQIFYHKIGTFQNDDKLIFDATKTEGTVSFHTKQGKLFIKEESKDRSTSNYYYANLNAEPFVLTKYLDNESNGFQIINYIEGRIYFSSKESDWGEIRSFDINNRVDEKLVVSQLYNNLLVDANFYEDYIICKYKVLGNNYMIVYDKNGGFVRRFDVPYGMDFSTNFLNEKTKELFVTFYSYTIPYLNYTLNIETGKSNPYFNDFLPPKPTLFPFNHFETKIITYKSRDNQDIPITIIYKKGLILDGTNPTLLNAYGGFGLVIGPSYDTGLLYFLEKGGVYAYAEIRGGGEKGRKWHKNGMGLKKMNCFNDFIDAAEYLIAEKYTSPNKLAITGGSQGGLLVGVAMTQRPELFKVVVPYVGMFDMIQFDEYTIGKYLYEEYGNPANETEFKYLLNYSPFHNIKEDVNYPTTLIITSDNDDRVPPFHSYKFAARLQNRTAQKNPIYLKTMSNSGHYGKISTYKKRIEEKAAFYEFLLFHLNQ
jgi:prolyl oligopeptidase